MNPDRYGCHEYDSDHDSHEAGYRWGRQQFKQELANTLTRLRAELSDHPANDAARTALDDVAGAHHIKTETTVRYTA